MSRKLYINNLDNIVINKVTTVIIGYNICKSDQVANHYLCTSMSASCTILMH